MNVTEIPFNKSIEITTSNLEEQTLELEFKDHLKNHLGTFHASAQFALAEACSGQALQLQFPNLASKVVPVLRKSDIKFKRPAQSKIRARAQIDDQTTDKFRSQFERKGRATISVSVEIIDQEDTVTMTGSFEWFIQKL
jgi:thioesterase domain-containing protein